MKNHILKTLAPFTTPFSTGALRNLTHKPLLFPFYHSVAYKPLPHIDKLYETRSVKQFESDLNFLLKYYEPISPEKALKHQLEKSKPQKPSFLLSFDDGLSGFYHFEAPRLLKQGIPAIIFLNSAFIDNKDLFYRYKASLLINHLNENPELIKLILVFFADNGIVKPNHQESLLAIRYKNRHLLDQAAKICGIDFSEFLKTYKPYLSSQQITELSQKGFVFGAHSVDHPNFSELNPEEQFLQIKKSIDEIKKFNPSLNLFAFPFTDYGVKAELFEKLYNQTKPILDFSFGGAGLKNEFFSRHIQRIPMEGSQLSGKNIIKTEYLYYLLKSIAGKNTIHRS